MVLEMSVPNFKNKYTKKALFFPNELVECQKKAGKFYKGKPPEGVIFCYEQELQNYILKKHRTKKIKNPYGDMYLLPETKNKIAVISNFGFGAPAIAVIFEELISIGVKKFISIGTAGTIQRGLRHGDIVICAKAIRDEGTSYHYLKPSEYAYASKKIIQKIKDSFKKFKQKYIVGSSWTMDAMFRETPAEVKHYQKMGITTVDMEAATFFAIGKYRKTEVGIIFTISDSLVEKNWVAQFHNKDTYKGLEALYKVAVNALS